MDQAVIVHLREGKIAEAREMADMATLGHVAGGFFAMAASYLRRARMVRRASTNQHRMAIADSSAGIQ
jgi:hypothetical protein